MTNVETSGTLGCSDRNSNSQSDVRGNPPWWEEHFDKTGEVPPPWAIRAAEGFLQVGAQLSTRDGRKTGNAVIIGEQAYRPSNEQKREVFLYAVLTDAGNTMRLTTEEVLF